jgi:hypothetical protein
VRVIERFTGTAEGYVLAGTVARDEGGHYVADAKTYLLTVGPFGRPLRSIATTRANGPDLQAAGASAPEARARLCTEAKTQLGAAVISFVWRPVLSLVSPHGVAPMRSGVRTGALAPSAEQRRDPGRI